MRCKLEDLEDAWNIVELDPDMKMPAVSSLTEVKPGLLVPQRDLSKAELLWGQGKLVMAEVKGQSIVVKSLFLPL